MREGEKIPRIIHYCWFGGNELPESVMKCINSWKKFCPDYEIKRWDETNFDVSINQYVSEAYKMKKWAFVSDYARLYVLYEHGGIYFDTDVEIIKPIDTLLNNVAFMGLESADAVASGLGVGSVRNYHMLKDLLDIYEGQSFIDKNGNVNYVATVKITTDYMITKGFMKEDILQKIKEMVIYPTEYFCPKKYGSKKVNITENTFSIHHYDFSWYEEKGVKKEIKMRTIPIKLFVRKSFRQLGVEDAYLFLKRLFHH